eukprot:859715-Prymnesium_polylepis.1
MLFARSASGALLVSVLFARSASGALLVFTLLLEPGLQHTAATKPGAGELLVYSCRWLGAQPGAGELLV